MKKFTLFLLVFAFIGCQRNDKLNTAEKLNSHPQMINLKYFGDMDCSDDPTTMWQKRITINNQKVFLELNYPKHANKKSLFLKNESTLEELENVIQKSRKELKIDFKNKGITKAFIKKQLEGFTKVDYEFHKIEQKQNSNKTEAVLLNTIELIGIGVFLVDSENHIILTYHIPQKGNTYGNQLLVKYNKKYDLSGIYLDR